MKQTKVLLLYIFDTKLPKNKVFYYKILANIDENIAINYIFYYLSDYYTLQHLMII